MIVMQIIHHVRPECVERYLEATIANAKATQQEEGNIRFDVLRDASDPCRFQLYEAYVNKQAQKDHLASAHFATWMAAVRDVFSDRSFHKYEAIHIPVKN